MLQTILGQMLGAFSIDCRAAWKARTLPRCYTCPQALEQLYNEPQAHYPKSCDKQNKMFWQGQFNLLTLI